MLSLMASEPRVPVTFRTGSGGVESLDAMAHEHKVDRTLVIRGMLAVASRHKSEVVKWIKEHQ